ncbi:hypothetical protein C4585_01955 [Candidatus Parcubacteria bacterium]|nr:MAG: hypothetical protein C4585_01955 [Candidatus Parcubacteria bacterium]
MFCEKLTYIVKGVLFKSDKGGDAAMTKLYIEQPRPRLGGFLSDEVYGEAIGAFVIDCVDFVPVVRQRKIFCLAKRVVESAKGIWRFGGRRKAGENMEEACVRLANRELDLTIKPSRFKYVTFQDCVWAHRAQEPKNVGCHTLIHVHTIELTPKEFLHAAANLDPKEYDLSFGIQRFDRERLIRENARVQLLDIYDLVFPD